ncbi:MAG TPA: YidC/Oxa1 family membrane protein insertase, partial [Armatimonadota bacterium]|nr:YidC/Oxa1 family membrane protein insertase [Armatimonadota bacterium]
MQQQQNPKDRLLTFAVMMTLWMATFLLFQHFFGPKPPTAPGATQGILQQAQQLEAAGRKDDPNVSRADRIKKLEEAVKKYDEFYSNNKNSVEGARAKFQEINIFDYLIRFDGKKGNTHWYDQAEQRLKQMEQDLHKLSGSVDLEVNGEIVHRTGNLGEIAGERLHGIRQARDVVNRSNWGYQILDFLVGLTGRNPAFSYTLALVLVVVTLKLLTWPFQKKQYQYQRDMMRIQPLIKEMQEKMKGRPPEEINRRMFQIYKENNVNLAGGCLP